MDIKKIIREEIEKLNEEIQSDLVLPKGKRVVLQADNPKVNRGLVVTWLEDGGYNVEYWYKDPSKIYPAEVVIDGKPITTDGKVVYLGYHPELDEGFGSDEFLTKTEKKKFEKERLENAEVLGYELTGTKDIKESINESKKEKDQIIKYLQVLGFDKRTAKNAVAKSYNYISKAYRNTGTRYKGDLIARILNKKESVFAVRQDKIKNGERFPKKPNFDYDPEKGKSRIRKVNEAMNPRAVKKMRDEFEKTGDLPPHLKKFALDLKILKKKHKVKNIVVPGLEWMSDMKEQSVNEARLDPKQTIQQLGGNRFLYMVGAKNLAVDKSRNELHMKIMRNAKGVSHVVVRLTSLDLYDMKFLQIRAGKIRVKAKEKGVYGDQLATFFKKHTGLNTRL